MSSELYSNLNLIVQEKATKILPENIKAGITILGVTGIYTGETTETTDTTTEEIIT